MKSPFYFKVVLGMIMCVLLPFSVQSQEVLSLDACIQIALKNNSQFRMAKSRVDVAGAQVLGAYAQMLPNFSANAGGSQQHQGPSVQDYNTAVYQYDNNGRPVVGPDGKPVVLRYVKTKNRTDPQIREFFNAGASFSQVIYDGGQWWNRIKDQSRNKEARTYDMQTTRLATITSVKQYYFELLKNQHQLIVLEDAVRLAEEQLKSSKSRYEIGVAAQIDVFRSQVSVNDSKVNLLTQKNMLEVAKTNLNVAMGREIDVLVVIQEDSTITPLPVSLENALKEAVQSNPRIKSATEDIASARYSYKTAKGGLLPTIRFNLGYSRSNPDMQQVYRYFDQNYSYQYSVSFSLPLFDGLRTKSNIQSAAYSMDIAEENLVDTQRKVSADAKQYYLTLTSNLEKVKMLEENLVAAEENLRLARERYNVGAGTLLETIDAQVQLTRARISLVSARYDSKIAQAQLEGALGKGPQVSE